MAQLYSVRRRMRPSECFMGGAVRCFGEGMGEEAVWEQHNGEF